MTDADWLAGRDPDGMLAAVADRLTDRQFHLLACGLTRRLWDALPAGDLRAAVEWCEAHAGAAHRHDAADDWLARVAAAVEPAREAARAAQREVVRTADPDADPDSFEDTGTTPATPLFQAACRYAQDAVEQAGEAAGHAAEVVAALIDNPPGEEQVAAVRAMVVEAARGRAAASLSATSALKLKAAGDAAADVDPRKNVNVRYAAALQKVTQEDEGGGGRLAEVAEQKEAADRKATVRLLHEVAGNPYRPFRFDPAWRTSDVVGLAEAIYAGRHFDRMPVLADALLDADCDEEAVLRHCRGTELHAPDGPAHVRGCWVLDQILGHDAAYFQAPPLVPPPPPPPAPARKTPPALSGMDRLLQALQKADAGGNDE